MSWINKTWMICKESSITTIFSLKFKTFHQSNPTSNQSMAVNKSKKSWLTLAFQATKTNNTWKTKRTKISIMKPTSNTIKTPKELRWFTADQTHTWLKRTTFLILRIKVTSEERTNTISSRIHLSTFKISNNQWSLINKDSNNQVLT